MTSDTSIPIVLLSIVKPPNFPPYFTGDLTKSLEINLEDSLPGQEWVIQLPSIFDPNWDDFSLTVKGLNDKFMFFDQKKQTLTFKGVIEEFIGDYEINLILTDTLFAERENKIKISVVRKALFQGVKIIEGNETQSDGKD